MPRVVLIRRERDAHTRSNVELVAHYRALSSLMQRLFKKIETAMISFDTIFLSNRYEADEHS